MNIQILIFFVRTARFGSALLMQHPGCLNLKSTKFKLDFKPIDSDCNCSTCKTVSRAYIHSLVSRKEPSGAKSTFLSLEFYSNEYLAHFQDVSS